MTPSTVCAAVLSGLLLAVPNIRAAEVALVNADTSWRAFLVIGPRLEAQAKGFSIEDWRKGGSVSFDPAGDKAAGFHAIFSPLPPTNWFAAEFNDSQWPQYSHEDLEMYVGGYGYRPAGRGAVWPALLCLRTRFWVSDPAQVRDLRVSVACIGGAVVCVNGREIGRGFMPEGAINPLMPAGKYSAEAYEAPGTNMVPDFDGNLVASTVPLPELAQHRKENRRPAAALLPHYEKRIRRVTFPVPSDALVKDANVLSVEIHQAPISKATQSSWVHLGYGPIALAGAAGGGARSCTEAVATTRIWNANPEEQVFDRPLKDPDALLGKGGHWSRGKPYRGVRFGNPFDPVTPVRMVAPRNGVCSGQIVVSDPAGVKALAARMGPLKGPGGQMPQGAVEIRYAAQNDWIHYCDALLPEPPAGAGTIPVWIVVEIPKDQTPGWYTGTLTVKANGRDFEASVQVLATGAVLPDARNLSPNVNLASSADTIALHYGVKPWSDEHFRLIRPSLRMLGQVGNDVVQIPVILGGMYGAAARNWTSAGSARVRCAPLVRWVKDGEDVKPEFSLLEKYLDAYLEFCAPPKALSFYVWDSDCTQEDTLAYEGQRIPLREAAPRSPLLVQLWNPATGETAELKAPNIGEKGSEAFWKSFFAGARDLVTKRGWSERVIMAGLGGDLRPSQRQSDLLREWAPYVRWHILSHFSGDPGPKDGKQIATGGMEIGVKEYPWYQYCTVLTADQLIKYEADTRDYLDVPTVRWHWGDESTPFFFRAMPQIWGHVGHLGLDFWPGVRGAPRNTSFFTHSSIMSVPGPAGAVPTVRFQMLREGVADMDLRWTLVRAAINLPAERRKEIHDLLDEQARRAAWNVSSLNQCEIGYGWRSYVARVQEMAAEVARANVEAKWAQPPR